MNLQERRFQIWDATASLGRVLIRCPKNETSGYHTNIDLLFWGVCYLNLAFLLRGIQIESATATEIAQVEAALGRTLREETLYILVSSGHRYQIAAATYRLEENTRDLFETSIE